MNNRNKNSLEKLFKSYARGMYNICIRMTGNKQDAEDILHDAFYTAFVNYDKLKKKESFGSWIRTIVVNHCVSFVRKKIHFVDIELHEADTNDDDTTWMHSLSMSDINAEIQQLPDGSRVVFNMFLLENYSHKQIAEMLDISESTSKSQYHRAKQLLRDKLTKKLQNG